MTDQDVLGMLKVDLEISVDSTSTVGQNIENLLTKYIILAKQSITREGITLDSTLSDEDGTLVMMYAAFLYRKRREVLVAMPRQLRFLLNNRLISEKGQTEV